MAETDDGGRGLGAAFVPPNLVAFMALVALVQAGGGWDLLGQQPGCWTCSTAAA